MTRLKAQLHVHTKQDPHDNIKHTEKEKIDYAAKHGYDVMAISCHNVLIYNEDLKKYAAEKRILLIPAIEKTIENKHVLILNATIESQKIETFNDLRLYKKKNPQCLIIAPHPYYPGKESLRNKLDENIDIFDAIEYSWFHSKRINKANEKAIKTAEKNNLPILGTSDNHLLRYFDNTYSIIESKKNIESIFNAIKAKKCMFISHGTTPWQMITSMTEVLIRLFIKKATLR